MTKDQEDSIFALIVGSNIHLGEEGAIYVATVLLKRIKEILETT
jgi:hypothetical protein